MTNRAWRTFGATAALLTGLGALLPPRAVAEFGPPSITAHPGLAVEAGAAILVDLFGTIPEAALAGDATIRSCQGGVLKAMQRCVDDGDDSNGSCR